MANDHTPQTLRTQSAIVKFHGYEITSWRDERTGDVYSSLASMCKPLGIGSHTQIERCKGNPLFSEYMQRGTDIRAPLGGPQDPWL